MLFLFLFSFFIIFSFFRTLTQRHCSRIDRMIPKSKMFSIVDDMYPAVDFLKGRYFLLYYFVFSCRVLSCFCFILFFYAVFSFIYLFPLFFPSFLFFSFLPFFLSLLILYCFFVFFLFFLFFFGFVLFLFFYYHSIMFTFDHPSQHCCKTMTKRSRLLFCSTNCLIHSRHHPDLKE